MPIAIRNATALFTLGILAACGGGGGGSASSAAPAAVSTATLSTSNQTVASQDVAATALGLFGTSQTALGAVTANESGAYAEAFAQLDRLPTYITDAHANAVAVGAVQSQTYSCPSGGGYTISVTDADNSGTASAGDSFAAVYSNCNSGSGVLNGLLSFRIDALSGSYGALQSTVGVTMTFGNFTLTASTYSASINGALSVAGSKTGVNAFSQNISTSSLSASATYGSVTRSRTLSNYSATETRTPDASATYLSQYSVGGTISSTGFAGTQAVSFSTPTPLVRRASDAYAYTGSLLITGANNSALRLTALSNALVREDLDANGDGVFESTSTVAWNSLL